MSPKNTGIFRIPSKFRVVKTVFLENGVVDPYRKQVLTKNGEDDNLHSTHQKKGAALLKARKPTKMTKIAGVLQTKPGFAQTSFLPP